MKIYYAAIKLGYARKYNIGCVFNRKNKQLLRDNLKRTLMIRLRVSDSTLVEVVELESYAAEVQL